MSTRRFVFSGCWGRERGEGGSPGEGGSCFLFFRVIRRVTSLLTDFSRFASVHPALSEDVDPQRSCPAWIFCVARGAVGEAPTSCGSIGSCSLTSGSSSLHRDRLSASISTGSCSLSVGGVFCREELEATEFGTDSVPCHRAGRDGQGKLIYLY